jgi:hypothetical protein
VTCQVNCERIADPNASSQHHFYHHLLDCSELQMTVDDDITDSPPQSPFAVITSPVDDVSDR